MINAPNLNNDLNLDLDSLENKNVDAEIQTVRELEAEKISFKRIRSKMIASVRNVRDLFLI
jgi:hypothetical protein